MLRVTTQDQQVLLEMEAALVEEVENLGADPGRISSSLKAAESAQMAATAAAVGVAGAGISALVGGSGGRASASAPFRASGEDRQRFRSSEVDSDFGEPVRYSGFGRSSLGAMLGFGGRVGGGAGEGSARNGGGGGNDVGRGGDGRGSIGGVGGAGGGGDNFRDSEVEMKHQRNGGTGTGGARGKSEDEPNPKLHRCTCCFGSGYLNPSPQ